MLYVMMMSSHVLPESDKLSIYSFFLYLFPLYHIHPVLQKLPHLKPNNEALYSQRIVCWNGRVWNNEWDGWYNELVAYFTMRMGQWIFDCTWSTKLPMINLKQEISLYNLNEIWHIPFPTRKIPATHNETNGWIGFNILNEHLTRACGSWYEQQILHIIKSGIIEHFFDLLQPIIKLGFKLPVTS